MSIAAISGLSIAEPQPLTIYSPGITPAERSALSPDGNAYLPGTPGYEQYQKVVGGEISATGQNSTVNVNTAKGQPHGFFGSVAGDISSGVNTVGNTISDGADDAASAIEGVGEGAVNDAVSGLFSGFESWLETNLERGALYAVLIIGGLVLAGYGTVHLLEPSRGGAGLGALKPAAVAA